MNVTVAADVEEAERAAVEAAFERYWEVFTFATDIQPAERESKFAEVMVEPELSHMLNLIQQADERGIKNSGTVTHRYQWPVPINGRDKANIIDCMDQSEFGAWSIAEDRMLWTGPARGRMDITMVRDQGVWKVSAIVYPAVKC